jgi:transcriptional regulator with XRE-family HTH domain
MSIGTPLERESTIGDMGRNIGVRLRHARKLRGLSQAALAKASGVKQASISNLETGESLAFKGTTLVSIAQTLKVNPEWLATGKGHMDGSEPPLPAEAIKFARQWLKLAPEVRNSVAAMVTEMVKTSAAESPAVPDERVETAYDRPGVRKSTPNK